MALDRPSIIRRDFPTHRRGYDPQAVDAHLDELATEVEALQRRAAEPATLSQQAGEQVKAIVQAAERGAQEIRDSAEAEGREHVARVTEAAERLRGRIEQMERDIVQVFNDLRVDVERLHRDLVGLQTGVSDLSAAAPASAEQAAPVSAEPSPPVAAEPAAPASAEPPAPAPAPPAQPPAADKPANGDDTAARIVALNMALSGTPRAETDRFLAENYAVPDRKALLDEVYDAAGN
ncbi:MAG TPA: DivIVA domain-containing protein [Solirubrobacteraceae bacterium]